MVSNRWHGGRTFLEAKGCILREKLERAFEECPYPLAKRLAHRTIDNKVDGGVEDEEKVIKGNEDEEGYGIGQIIHFLTIDEMFLGALIGM